MPIDYNAEVKRLDSFVPGNKVDYWKPTAGQYLVRPLSELEETEPFKKEGKEPQEQVKIDLLIGDKKLTWTMARGKSPACAYGQLCKLAQKKGKLIGVDFMIVVVTDNSKKNTYTIVELPK